MHIFIKLVVSTNQEFKSKFYSDIRLKQQILTVENLEPVVVLFFLYKKNKSVFLSHSQLIFW